MSAHLSEHLTSTRSRKIALPISAKLTVSVDEGAAMLGISRSKLFAMVKAGEVPKVRIGGRTLLRRTDLEKLVESNLCHTPAE